MFKEWDFDAWSCVFAICVCLAAAGFLGYTALAEHNAQPGIVSEAKTSIMENQNKDIKTFMFATPDGRRMTVESKQEIVNYAGAHGLSVVESDERTIIFEKKS